MALTLVGSAVAGVPGKSHPKADRSDRKPSVAPTLHRKPIAKRSGGLVAAKAAAADDSVVLIVESDSVVPQSVITIVEVRSGKSKRA